MLRIAAIAASLLLATSAVAAHAQTSVYVTYSPTHLTNVATGTFRGQQQYTGYWKSGIGAGVTLGILPAHFFSVGLDMRGSTRPGTFGFDTVMVGLKLGVHPPSIRIKPYIQASAGYLGTRTVSTPGPVGSTHDGHYAAWEILGGLDYPLTHFVDLRVIELGGGQGISTGSGSNAGLFTVNTGLVVHF